MGRPRLAHPDEQTWGLGHRFLLVKLFKQVPPLSQNPGQCLDRLPDVLIAKVKGGKPKPDQVGTAKISNHTFGNQSLYDAIGLWVPKCEVAPTAISVQR